MFKNYKEGDTITEKEYQDINNAVNLKWKNLNFKKLEENATVFFDHNVQTSRTEFKKQYPTNKIVHSLKDAQYYIIKNKPSVYISFYTKKVRILDKNDIGKYNLKSYLENLNRCVDFINSKNKFINSEEIVFTSENGDLPQEMKEKILLMMQSDDKETFNLGWKILFKYDHIKFIEDFHLILSRANPSVFWRRTKSRLIESKLKQIKAHFPNSKY